MAKSARARRAKKADFQKVKLKVGKHLPRGLNVTDTSFRTRKIIITQQHKTPVAAASDNASSDIRDTSPSDALRQFRDLLTRVRNTHGGGGIRCEALDKLATLLTAHWRQLASAHFGAILSVIGGLLSSEEQRLRVRAHSLMLVCVSPPLSSTSTFSSCSRSASEDAQYSTASALPSVFADSISTHLVCALTHLDCDVRHTALETLGRLLQPPPASGNPDHHQLSLIGCVDRLLPCLLEQLPATAAGKSASFGGAGSCTRRMLLDNPSVRVSAVEWRCDVLSHATQLLDNLLTAHEPDRHSDSPVTSSRRFRYPADGEFLAVMDSPTAGAGAVFATAAVRCRLLSDASFTRTVVTDAMACLRRGYAEVLSACDNSCGAGEVNGGLSVPDGVGRLLLMLLRLSCAVLRLVRLCEHTMPPTAVDFRLHVWLAEMCVRDSHCMSVLRAFPVQSCVGGPGLRWDINRRMCELIAALALATAVPVGGRVTTQRTPLEPVARRVLEFIAQQHSGKSRTELDTVQRHALLAPLTQLLNTKHAVSLGARRRCVRVLAEYFTHRSVSATGTSSAAVRAVKVKMTADDLGVCLLRQLLSGNCLSLWFARDGNFVDTEDYLDEEDNGGMDTATSEAVERWAGSLLPHVIGSGLLMSHRRRLLECLRRVAFLGPADFLQRLEAFVYALLAEISRVADTVRDCNVAEASEMNAYCVDIVNLMYPIRERGHVRTAVAKMVTACGGPVSDGAAAAGIEYTTSVLLFAQC